MPSRPPSCRGCWTSRVGSSSSGASSERACCGSARPSDVAERPPGGRRVARQLRQLTKLGDDLDLAPPKRSGERDDPALVTLLDGVEREIVESGEAFLCTDS